MPQTYDKTTETWESQKKNNYTHDRKTYGLQFFTRQRASECGNAIIFYNQAGYTIATYK